MITPSLYKIYNISMLPEYDVPKFKKVWHFAVCCYMNRMSVLYTVSCVATVHIFVLVGCIAAGG